LGEKTQSTLEVMDLTTICHSFPQMPELLIPRDNLLNTVERMFGGDIELVMIEGEEGLGKTTLLAQFAQWHPNRTFSIFIKAASRFGYDPATVRYDLLRTTPCCVKCSTRLSLPPRFLPECNPFFRSSTKSKMPRHFGRRRPEPLGGECG